MSAMIISAMDKWSGGFFSQFFFNMNHYLTAKTHGFSFHLDTDHWLFKYKSGWTDYFLPIDVFIEPPEKFHRAMHSHVLGSYSLQQYRDVIGEMYQYNETMNQLILEKKRELGLIDRPYDSIFIRRGDKLTWESKYIHTEDYLDLLLKRSPECSCIFVQTDDYNSVLDLKRIIEERGLSIEVLTLCQEDQRGVIVFQHNLQNNRGIDNLEDAVADKSSLNNEYLNTIIHDLRNTKPVDQMTPDEIYEHTITMLIGIDIVLQSGYCICDYQSNVSRFIKLAHPNLDHVIDIMAPDGELDMSVLICPSYGFSEEERKRK
jgi:hypothetical protein